MELNKIQKQIYDEYKKTGRVWAEMPRKSGKTELLAEMAVEELLAGKIVYIHAWTKAMENMLWDRIYNGLLELKKSQDETIYMFSRLRRGSTGIIESEDMVQVFDDAYIAIEDVRQQDNIICLRTRRHQMFLFTYKDLEPDAIKHFEKIKDNMSDLSRNIEFEGGLLNKIRGSKDLECPWCQGAIEERGYKWDKDATWFQCCQCKFSVSIKNLHLSKKQSEGWSLQKILNRVSEEILKYKKSDEINSNEDIPTWKVPIDD